jgi:myo-inositol-1(or 4)-monophosphatase
VSVPWLETFQAIGAEVEAAVAPLTGTARAKQVMGRGAGGDGTVYIDKLAEDIVVRHLEGVHGQGARFTLLSEELGERDFGDPETIVLVDPVDGSLNAKQGFPYYSITLALVQGGTIGGTEIGYVRNLANGGEFHARRGGGAWFDGRALEPAPVALDRDKFGVVQLEAPQPAEAFRRVERLLTRTRRLRILGSVALDLCYTATGGFALLVAPLSVRSFDCAGALLILEEAGGIATSVSGQPLSQESVRLDHHITILASMSQEVHALARTLL